MDMRHKCAPPVPFSTPRPGGADLATIMTGHIAARVYIGGLLD